MTIQAKIYIGIVISAGVFISIYALLQGGTTPAKWIDFAILVVLATAAHLLKVEGGNYEAWHFNLSFFLAGILLLPPSLLIMLVVVPHAIEWIKESTNNESGLRNWYIQPFNISAHLISAITAHWLFTQYNPDPTVLTSANAMLVVIIAAAVYVVINHALIGQVLVLARGISWHESGIMRLGHLAADLAVLMQGYIVAIAWRINPLLIIPSLSPLLLMYRGLLIPKLEQEARIDEKTGLWNARHFKEIFKTEMARAQELERPLSTVMADLDLLRNINNQYGHLAGDIVLAEVGKLIRQSLESYHIAARFGGEEFCIIMPETEPHEAFELAEGIRAMIEAHHFIVPGSDEPLNVTISMGIASFPDDADTIANLIHNADVALYHAKSCGRNRVHNVANSASGEMPDYAALLAQETAIPSSPVITNNQDVSTAENTAPKDAREPKSEAGLKFMSISLIGSVIIAGLAIMSGSLFFGAGAEWKVIFFLSIVALIVQFLQIPMYGEMSISASMAVVFAAAMLTGIPGVSVVSLAIAITHSIKRRPTYYKFLYNWAVHILAGLVPALFIQYAQIPFELSNLHLLILPAVLGAVFYYVIDTGLVAAAISFTQGLSLISTWKEQFRWLAGHYFAACLGGFFLALAYSQLGLIGLLVFILPIFMMHYAQKQYSDHTRQSVKELRRMNEELSQATREIEKANRAIVQMNHELFQTLAHILDARDPYVHNHSLQVGEYATAIATRLGLSPARIEHTRQAAYLHDIGKIGIAEGILHKPDRLTDDEYEIVKQHVSIGAGVLEISQSLRHLAPLIKFHHERWDGNGYPIGLKGEEIPVESRILAICDSVEAMASDRPYHKAMSLDAIVTEIQRCSGSQFDPTIVEVFCEILEEHGANLVINSARQEYVTTTHRNASKPERKSEDESPVMIPMSLFPAHS